MMRLYPLVAIAVVVLGIHDTYGQGEIYRIALDSSEQAYGLGIPLDHGVAWVDDSLSVPAEHLAESLLEDLSLRFRKTRRTPPTQARSGFDDCGRQPRLPVTAPTNFAYGELFNGYYSLQDTWDAFDEMRSRYPALISERLRVDTFLTHEGRQLYYYRLSDNPGREENEPRVFINSLHHAREPAALLQTVYFAWWLLERYGSDPHATWLIDNTELYLMPIVNPDGYAFNGALDGPSLGFWRKNRRPNPDGTFGVDLNRNYPYAWGGLGSSDDPDSDIYHGPGPLSEPETQAIDYLHRRYSFGTVLNVHSFSDLVITPDVGATGNVELDRVHAELSWSMRADNRYGVGDGLATVGYVASGNSDDYFAYWEADSKPIALSFTPEIGDIFTGFMPGRSELEQYLAESVLVNYRALQSVHPTLIAEAPLPPNYLANPTATWDVVVRNPTRQRVSALMRISSSSSDYLFSRDTFTVSVPAGQSQTVVVPAPEPLRQSSDHQFTISFPALQHVRPWTVSYGEPSARDTILYEDFEGQVNAFNAEVTSTTIPGYETVSGFIGQPSFGMSTEFDVSLAEQDIVVSYDHAFNLESNFPAVTFRVVPVGEDSEGQCTDHTSDSPAWNRPSFWGSTPGFVRDRWTDRLSAGRYRLEWSFDQSALGGRTYLLDNVLVEAFDPLVWIATDEQQFAGGLRLYPNPASSWVMVRGDAASYLEAAPYQVLDGLGRTVGAGQLTDGLFDVSQLTAGTYTLVVSSQDNGPHRRVRLVVSR